MSSPASSIPPHLNPLYPPNLSPNSRSRSSPTASPQTTSSPRSSPRTGSTGAMDVESVLRINGGDLNKALEGIVLDRNNLQAQNTQLWKLIERQRAQCAQFAADNDRLRQDRERANARLLEAGLEPVGRMKRTNPSTSMAGLGVKIEIPQIKRNYSDNHDISDAARHTEKLAAEEITPSLASPDQQEQKAPSGLLPSLISNKKSQRESHLIFPPEVSTFMSMADSPKDMVHSVSPIPVYSNYSSPDPSPKQQLVSARADGREIGSIEPPPSSKALAASINTPEMVLVSPQPTIPPPAQRGASLDSNDSAHKPAVESTLCSSQVKLSSVSSRSETMSSIQSISETTSCTSNPSLGGPSQPSTESLVQSLNIVTPRQSSDQASHPQRQQLILQQQGQVQSENNSVPYLSPSLLPHTRITIPSSTVFSNSSGRDVLCFIVEISVRPPNAQAVSWNTAKLLSAFIDLDNRIKSTSKKSRKEWKQMVAPLPDGKSWKDFAPSKIDQRKSALESYLQSLLVAPLSDKSDLCRFLSTDHVQAKKDNDKKEGYLTKKGKNFGGWKTRYFTLEGPVMEYYESRGGNHLGSIIITGAQIGRQNRPSESSDERDFRHAFLIIEAGKKGTTHRHVLCAESDMERDRWIEILVRHVDPEPLTMPIPQPLSASSSQPKSQTSAQSSTTQQLRRKPSQLRKQSKDVVVSSAQPLAKLHNAKFVGAPSPSLFNKMEMQRAERNQSPTTYSPIQAFPVPHAPSLSSPQSQSPAEEKLPPKESQHQRSQQSLGNSVHFGGSNISELQLPFQTADTTPRASKRQSIMPNRPSHAPNFLTGSSNLGSSSISQEKERERKVKSRGFWGFGKAPEKPSRPVFGTPLTDSLEVANVAKLPAIVFRCIEWLEAKKAEEEEGIYRLSGSSAVIKGLKERFDSEGDVNLLAVDEHWDPHAIAGLLKAFLRELPTSLLTRELHTRFLAVMDLVESSARIAELSKLVSELPPPNYALLRSLSAHLILVVQNSHINKMTLRNIGIVFSPTLGIPAGIFSELISNFGPIFDDEGESLDTRASDSEAGSSTLEETEVTVKRKRNSMLYQAGGTDTLLGLSGRQLDPTKEDSELDESSDDFESPPSSDINHSANSASPTESHLSVATAQKSRIAAQGLTVDTNWENKGEVDQLTANNEELGGSANALASSTSLRSGITGDEGEKVLSV
ncbi:hypothetical protein L204_102436 [Cryptococcus depauperatus]|nr:hypothetical protein L204_00816 [Cryptococcus depauperatus CBS 7855]